MASYNTVAEALAGPTNFEDALALIADEATALLFRKHLDYGERNILNSPFGAQQGLVTRIYDKVARLANLLSREDPDCCANFESIRDTWMDIANYGLIGLMVEDGTFGLPINSIPTNEEVDYYYEDYEEVGEMTTPTFWIIWNETFPAPPRMKFSSRADAEEAAQSMALRYSDKFHVMVRTETFDGTTESSPDGDCTENCVYCAQDHAREQDSPAKDGSLVPELTLSVIEALLRDYKASR